MEPLDFILNFGGVVSVFSQQYSEWIMPLFFVLIFCETGLVLTPFLPGSTLLVIAGGLAADGDFTLYEIFGLLMTAALLGDSMGFFFGRLLGLNSTFIKPTYLSKANAFQNRFGTRAYAFARFVPIARGLVPFIAGANNVPYRSFLPANAAGVILCVSIFCSFGYFSAQLRNVPLAIWVAIALATVLTAAILLWRWRRLHRDAPGRAKIVAPPFEQVTTRKPDHDPSDHR